MITNVNDFDLAESAERGTVEDMEQNILFLGTHSGDGHLKVQFVAGQEAVCLEIQNPELRTKMLSILLDAVGGELEKLRQEARPAKYLPKPGDVVTTPETDFPMTVETFDQATMSCSLIGFAPGSAEPTRLPWVCALDLTPVTAEA